MVNKLEVEFDVVKFKSLRKSKKINQEKMAAVLGVSQQLISKIESGGDFDVSIIDRLEKYFKLNSGELFFDPNNKLRALTTAQLNAVIDVSCTALRDSFSIMIQANHASGKNKEINIPDDSLAIESTYRATINHALSKVGNE